MTRTPTASGTVGNPFSTRHVRPGRIAPLDGAGRPLDVGELLAALATYGGSGALVGPHGSGKTTLLWALAGALEAAGGRVERARVRGPRDILPLAGSTLRCAGGGTLCVDSWERLGRVPPWLLRGVAWLCGARLLVTAHGPGPLPTLWRCVTSPALLMALVVQLSRAGDVEDFVGACDLDDVFRRAGGDVREALFLLYDRFEERARSSKRS